MGINERISYIIQKLYAGNKRAFSLAIGTSPAVIENIVGKRKSAPSFEITSKIISSIDNISADWFITGKGNMLLNGDKAENRKPSTIRNEETRPRLLYDVLGGSLDSAIRECAQEPMIKSFAKYDFTILTKGDSMLPEFRAGDELVCLFIEPSDFVQWGQFHVLETKQGVIVKRILDDDKNIICKSENTEIYKDFRVPKSDITNMALIIGLVRCY